MMFTAQSKNDFNRASPVILLAVSRLSCWSLLCICSQSHCMKSSASPSILKSASPCQLLPAFGTMLKQSCPNLPMFLDYFSLSVLGEVALGSRVAGVGAANCSLRVLALGGARVVWVMPKPLVVIVTCLFPPQLCVFACLSPLTVSGAASPTSSTSSTAGVGEMSLVGDLKCLLLVTLGTCFAMLLVLFQCLRLCFSIRRQAALEFDAACHGGRCSELKYDLSLNEPRPCCLFDVAGTVAFVDECAFALLVSSPGTRWEPGPSRLNCIAPPALAKPTNSR